MEYGSIEREIRVDATPEVVYEVISTPEHLKGWWPDDAELEPAVGGTGVLTFGDLAAGGQAVPLTVVEADPPRRFAFRWGYDRTAPSTADTALLVTFELVPSGAGTLLRMTESGFREQGWEAAVLEERYREHSHGWDLFIPQLGEYVTRLVATP